MSNDSLRRAGLLGVAVPLSTSVFSAAPAQAAGPGNARTAAFEKDYIESYDRPSFIRIENDRASCWSRSEA
jgi:hypothetical protein